MERAGWGKQSPQKLEAHPHPGQKRDRRADEDLATKQGTGAVVRKETGPRSSRPIHLRCRAGAGAFEAGVRIVGGNCTENRL